MLTKLASFAAAALVLASIAPPAHAGVRVNGTFLNGTFPNGTFVNGLRQNGTFVNGTFINGYSINSRNMQGTATGAAGFAIESIELPVAQ